MEFMEKFNNVLKIINNEIQNDTNLIINNKIKIKLDNGPKAYQMSSSE
jgi:hypothetical protein